MKLMYTLVAALLCMLNVNAQLSNDSLEYRLQPDSARTGAIDLSIHSFNYLRNYEFFNEFQDGYTLYGTQLEPQLVYYAHPRLVLSAGIHLRKDFGNEGIYKTYPLFSIKYGNRRTSLIAGALEGNSQHRFIEPLYDFERKITHPVEYGTQLVVNKPGLFLDAFINWDKMIYKPSGENERIFAGLSTDIGLLRKGRLKLSLPLQALVFHKGGQIDTLDKPIQTLINAAGGLRLSYKTDGFVRSISTENYILAFKDSSPDKQLAYSGGSGIYLNAGLDTRYGTFAASYWHASQYLAVAGMPVFQSVSQKLNKEGYASKKRSLLFLRYAYQQMLVPGLHLDFRVEPLWDVSGQSSGKLDFYHSLFLVYKHSFRLAREKQ